jgi:DNA-binding GntR family transcriptional regulator
MNRPLPPKGKWQPSVSSVDGRYELTRLLRRRESSGSIAEEIAITLATEIIEGRLVPGDDLNSVELAKTFESSRTPVREALFVLEREGFVEIPARRRPHVARHSLAEIRELYMLRAELYGMVSREVVRVATANDLELLHGHQAALAQAVDDEDVDAYFWVNVQFRNTEADIACGQTMRRVLDTLGLRALQLRHLSLSQPGRLHRSLADHGRLLQAYEDRDATLASALTRSLVLRGFAAIESSGWNGDQS